MNPECETIDGKVVVITGATSGIGTEAARALAQMGGRVVLVVRDNDRGQATRSDIIETVGADTIIYLASSPDVEGVSGGYYEKRRRVEPSREARDPEMAMRLWRLSEELTGLANPGA